LSGEAATIVIPICLRVEGMATRPIYNRVI
jgi:hypothetical protein